MNHTYFRTVFLVWLFTVLLVNCAYNAAVAPPAKQIENKSVLNMPFDVAWKKTLGVLTGAGFSIKMSNKQDGIITTEMKLVRLNETQADCGNIWGIPYTKDTRTTTNVAFSVLLRDSSGKTDITVNSQIEGFFVASAMDTGKKLSCYSLGSLEKDLIEKIKR